MATTGPGGTTPTASITPRLPERVTAYIDGFNLFNGVRSLRRKDLYWIDLHGLITICLRPEHRLNEVKYFTTRLKNPPDKQRRQSTYIDALRADGKIHPPIYGDFQPSKDHRCPRNSCSGTLICDTCSVVRSSGFKEKMTDVNIATEMLIDAFADKFDVAVLVSGDGDLVRPARHLIAMGKKVIVLFPPNRKSKALAAVATERIDINENRLRHSQLPNSVQTSPKRTLTRPAEWT